MKVHAGKHIPRRRCFGEVRPPRDHVGFVCNATDLVVAAGYSVAADRWQAHFEDLMARVAGRFTRVESRNTARKMVAGLATADVLRAQDLCEPGAGGEGADPADPVQQMSYWHNDFCASQPALPQLDCRV